MKKALLFTTAFATTIALLSGCATLAANNSSAAATTTASAASKTDVQWAFTKANQHPQLMLIQNIQAAKQTLDIAIYSLTDKDIVNAILAAKQRGVQIRVITDKQEAGNRYQKAALQKLLQAGIPVKINTHRGLMHMKVSIIDHSVVTTGSFNYTEAASSTNDEVLVVLKNPEMAQSFSAQFDQMWNDREHFADYK